MSLATDLAAYGRSGRIPRPPRYVTPPASLLRREAGVAPSAPWLVVPTHLPRPTASPCSPLRGFAGRIPVPRRVTLPACATRSTHRATPAWLRSGPVTHPARLASSAARCAPVPTLMRCAAGMASFLDPTVSAGVAQTLPSVASIHRARFASRSVSPAPTLACNAKRLPRIPPPHIVCRPFLAGSSLPAHHARRPQLRPLAPYAPNAGRRPRAVVPPSRHLLSSGVPCSRSLAPCGVHFGAPPLRFASRCSPSFTSSSPAPFPCCASPIPLR